jgi:hypothetical protein
VFEQWGWTLAEGADKDPVKGVVSEAGCGMLATQRDSSGFLDAVVEGRAAVTCPM